MSINLTSKKSLNNRKRNIVQKKNTSIDSEYITTNIDNKEIELHINKIWDALRELSNNTTQSVKEAELKYGRKHSRTKKASMRGNIGQFRLKEVSDIKVPNVLEICGNKSWQKLAARIPDLEFRKVGNLSSAIAAGATPTKAEFDKVIADLATLKGKIDGIITSISNLDVFKLEDIPDENPNVDRDAIAIPFKE